MSDQPRSVERANAFLGSIVLAAVLLASGTSAWALDETRYPDWKGRWLRVSSGNYDPTKPPGQPQKPPLTPEYQAVFEASVADQAAGGQGNNPMAGCMPPGMPRMMILYGLGVEILVTPSTTYMVFGEPMGQLRRIYTDGRDWPVKVKPTFSGYSIGQWVDEDRDGRYDALAVETRTIRGPRSYDSSGMPFHRDGQTIVKERLYLDKTKRDLLHNEITVIDNALTSPWTIKREYVRKTPEWLETICGEDEHQVRIGSQDYFLSGERILMPTRAGQAPPDLRRFEHK
ncbi:MAG TPA: hypothetical protein VK148_00155 [Xanthobacteraceae bacterium]|nr:hypothetical protein [Xanthobacteraceae bacterium]